MAVASADLILGLPLNIAYLILKVQTSVDWPGFKKVHANWGYVREVSEDAIDLYFTDNAFTTISFLLYWVAPLLAFLFFIFFGVTEEAVREYGRWYDAARSFCGRSRDHRSVWICDLLT
jgi:pheromone a factor receptor